MTRRSRFLVVVALVPLLLLAFVITARRPFTRACTGDLAALGGDPVVAPEAWEAKAPLVAVVPIAAGPGQPGKLVHHPVAELDITTFSYGHDPPRWFTEVVLPHACGSQRSIGLGLMDEGQVEVRRSNELLVVTGREKNGERAFQITLGAPHPSRVYTFSAAGMLVIASFFFSFVSAVLYWKMRGLSKVLGWPEGVVREDGCLEPSGEGAPIPLSCGCAKKPGKRILYVPRRSPTEATPYREHGRGALADHATFSRKEGEREVMQLGIGSVACAAIGLVLGVIALVLAAT